MGIVAKRRLSRREAVGSMPSTQTNNKNLLPSSSLVTLLKTTQRCKCKWWLALDFFSSLGKMEAQKENSSDLLFPCWNLLLLVPRRVMSSLVRQTSQGPLDFLRSQWKSKKAQ